MNFLRYLTGNVEEKVKDAVNEALNEESADIDSNDSSITGAEIVESANIEEMISQLSAIKERLLPDSAFVTQSAAAVDSELAEGLIEDFEEVTEHLDYVITTLEETKNTLIG